MNWNSGDLLRKCLDALSRQTLPLERIIVVDNASEDGSVGSVEHRYEKASVVWLGRNAGFAAGVNTGIKAAGDCDWVALVNPDAVVAADWLERLIGAARKCPECAAFGCRLIQASDHSKLDGAGDEYHVSGAHWRRGHGEAEANRHLETEGIFAPCAAAALYRRDVFLELGGLDESFFCYAEDVDLGFRLQLSGHRCLYVPAAVAYHVGSATTGRRSDFSVYHGHRNLVWAYVKNMPGLLFWLYLPQHLLFNLASMVLYVMRGQGTIVLRAKWDAIKGLPRIWHQRKLVQAERQVGAWELRRLMVRGWLAPYFRRQSGR